MNALLTGLMQFAMEKTGAERAVAVNSQMGLVAASNMTQSDFLGTFNGMEVIRRALETGELVLTNNQIKDGANAPVTNTAFKDLRFVFVIPVAGQGAIYLDQTIRRGAVPRPVLLRLFALAQQAAQTALHPTDFEALYATLNA